VMLPARAAGAAISFEAMDGSTRGIGSRLFFLVLYFALWAIYFFVHYFVQAWAHIFLYVARRRQGSVDLVLLTTARSRIPSLPAHIAFVLDSYKTSPEQAAKLCSWCIALKIPLVTVYDRQGVLKYSRYSMERLLDKELKSLYGDAPPHFKLDKTLLERLSAIRKGEPFNIGALCRLSPTLPTDGSHVILASATDGRTGILEACKALSVLVQRKEVPRSELAKFETINGLLLAAEDGSISPAPDLVLKYDSTAVQAGFMPWHLRYSEILQLDSGDTNSFVAFERALARYARCNKRFGK